ncbi:immunoglobulin-binding protein 1-like [Dendronephthya gigantea]|uniref:immunoglobulin-binding protein 1-like n=1 Tax=Dendronephthya gigantea TaxID=151771 RepID=UPI00106A6C79|nr:immunoglobulin-binding protein 1-like [Dendronephthya gigantea]
MAAESLNLKEAFQHGFSIFKKIDSDDGPENSKHLQDCIREAIECFKKSVEMINDLALFSINEDLDEISTTDLRYMLVPALLGDLYLKLCSEERIDVVNVSKVYCLNYLERCKMYGLLKQDLNPCSSSEVTAPASQRSLNELANERNAKIARFKKMKEEEKRIKELSDMLEISSDTKPDEELERKFNILLLEHWINKALESLSSINNEIPILEHMSKMRQQGGDRKRENEKMPNNEERKKNQLFSKPVLITRQAIQNKVFGAGYPSLPTMTQEEYFEKELRQGKIVTEFSENKTSKQKTDEENGKEEMDCAEDEKYLEKLTKEREWDDWKDDHRRGWGNRENMG